MSSHRATWVAIVVALLFTTLVFATQSARSEDPDHGDYWSDTMLVLAARNLNAHGFGNLRFGVTMDDGPALGLPPHYYVHWPSFPTVALATLFELGSSVRIARLFPLLVSSSALVAVFLLVRRVVQRSSAAFAAMAALAAQAPYRLLSDSFCYQSYDFAAKAWTILFITLACTSGSAAPGVSIGVEGTPVEAITKKSRRRSLGAAAVSSFATMFLSGFEMVPAIVTYAGLFPLLLGPPGWRRRAKLVARVGAAVGTGLVLALVARVAHNAMMLGSLGAAFADLGTAAGVRISTDFPRLLGWGFRWEMWLRMRDYHWLSLFVFATCALVLVALVRRGVEERRHLVWLGVIALGEGAWYLVFRHHTYFHPHTADHIALTLAVGTALGFDALWRAGHGRPVARGALVAASVAFLALSFANVCIRGRGNLQVRTDLSEFERQVRAVAALLPEDAVVSCWIDGREPCLDYWLRRKMLLWRGIDGEIDVSRHPVYVLALPGTREPRWKEFARKYRLVHRMPLGWDLFDTRLGPGPLNEEALTRS